jgi:heme/copper-type cytochrome/quinol oxidase subunit 2
MLALLLALGAVALVAAPAAGASIISPRAAHSPNADDIRTTYWVMLILAALIGLAINALLIVAVVRFRARRGPAPARVEAGRGVFARIAIPLGLVAVAIFVFGVVMTVKSQKVASAGPDGLSAAAAETAQVGVHGVSRQALTDATQELRNTEPAVPTSQPVKGGPLMIDAVAQQWIWRFFYPGGPGQTSKPGEIPPYSETGGRPGDRTYSVNELVVPVDTPVVLNITSTDVMHRWFVPALGGQVDAVPGNTSRTWFKADRIGLYPGQSTMFSGTGYSAMRTWVRVVSVPDYQSYLEKQTHELGAAQAYVQHAQETGNIPGGTP